ncbi:MAG: hypothetical protein ABSG95_10930 [Solirubrobacteraceae bacterium]
MIDRLATTLCDQRLLAHLAADEPAENARIVCSLYLADGERPHCRHLTLQDLSTDPFASMPPESVTGLERATAAAAAQLTDRRGYSYRLAIACNGNSRPELRWHGHPTRAASGCPELVTVRHVIGSLETYEPARALTAQALAAHAQARAVSVAALRAELNRVNASRIVLNRGLREAVLTAVEDHRLTMSEIAIRCGRLKRDANGNESGETSWLGRRIGTLAEHGKSGPTPWVSSDVLALIARAGLGVSPREVELA